MAIEKKVTLPNGIVVNYHRIVSITSIVNEMISVEVASYISEEARNQEIAALNTARKDGQYPDVDIFIYTNYYELPYVDSFSINDAYNAIKNDKEYKGSKDI